jgi:hypothetical protein
MLYALQLCTHDKTTLYNKFAFYFGITQTYLQPIGPEFSTQANRIQAFPFPGFLKASIDIWQNSLDWGSLIQETSSYNINTDVKHKLYPRTMWDCNT